MCEAEGRIAAQRQATQQCQGPGSRAEAGQQVLGGPKAPELLQHQQTELAPDSRRVHPAQPEAMHALSQQPQCSLTPGETLRVAAPPLGKEKGKDHILSISRPQCWGGGVGHEAVQSIPGDVRANRTPALFSRRSSTGGQPHRETGYAPAQLTGYHSHHCCGDSCVQQVRKGIQQLNRKRVGMPRELGEEVLSGSMRGLEGLCRPL